MQANHIVVAARKWCWAKELEQRLQVIVVMKLDLDYFNMVGFSSASKSNDNWAW